jgi:spermidine synthase
MTYYGPQTPIGQAFALYAPDAKRVGVVGLGTGSSACYARPGQDWTFFEIDPLVVEVATDPKHFSFMSSCAPDARIVIGDARIQIAGDPAQFDLMLLDAFSSDTIPTHLLTREAMELYLDRLGEDGVLVFHVTNRHLDLAPVVARVIEAAGAHALFQSFRPDKKFSESGVPRSDAVVISRSAASLDRARADARWSELKSDGARPWTDDYSNIIGAMLAKAAKQ